jgi:hypothetical protein
MLLSKQIRKLVKSFMNKDGTLKTTNLVMLLLMRIHCDILSNMWVACMNLKNNNMKIQRDVLNKIKTQINNSSNNVPKNSYIRIQIRNHPQKKFKKNI